MNLFRIRIVALAATVLLAAVCTASAQNSATVAPPAAVTQPNPKFNGLPDPVRATFRRMAAGGRVERITPIGYFYVGSVTTRDGRTVTLRVRRDGSIRSQAS